MAAAIASKLQVNPAFLMKAFTAPENFEELAIALLSLSQHVQVSCIPGKKYVHYKTEKRYVLPVFRRVYRGLPADALDG